MVGFYISWVTVADMKLMQEQFIGRACYRWPSSELVAEYYFCLVLKTMGGLWFLGLYCSDTLGLFDYDAVSHTIEGALLVLLDYVVLLMYFGLAVWFWSL